MIFLQCNQLDAFSTDVHIKITEKVIEQKLDSYNSYLKNIGLTGGIKEIINKKEVREWIKEGSIKEDYTVDILTSHFYNPLTNKGLTEFGVTIGESAYERANFLWQDARGSFYSGLISTTKGDREKSLSIAFETLGRIMHLVQDMAVPAHTRDDMHVADPFEGYISNRVGSLNYTLVPFQHQNLSISPYAPKQFWDTEFYNGSIAYDSTSIGLSEYTNANFFSKDTIFKEDFFPHPRRQDTNFSDFEYLPIIKITTPDNIEHNTFYISGYGKKHLVALKYFSAELLVLPIPLVYKKTLFLDNRCHEEYAQHLVPRAVGYSAGLLNYFFRGEIDMKRAPNPGWYIIKNLTSEPMSGTFELYYDDINNERHKIANWTLNIPAYGSESVSFQPPSAPEPKAEGEYILVFSGTMGEEQGAIVGKKVLIGCEPTITIVNEDGTQAKDTILRNQSNDYKVTGCLGTVEWSVSGTGGSITQNGVLTAGSNACGALGITATCPACGTSDTQDVRVTDAGKFILVDACTCTNPYNECYPVTSCEVYRGKYRYKVVWHCYYLPFYSCPSGCTAFCTIPTCIMAGEECGGAVYPNWGKRIYETRTYEWKCP
ncbi:MAG: hypothetical protein HY805_10350 [Nitrospirae bacterium]|nr:hypothetical protein [Nitrospirota bacterium]